MLHGHGPCSRFSYGIDSLCAAGAESATRARADEWRRAALTVRSRGRCATRVVQRRSQKLGSNSSGAASASEPSTAAASARSEHLPAAAAAAAATAAAGCSAWAAAGCLISLTSLRRAAPCRAQETLEGAQAKLHQHRQRRLDALRPTGRQDVQVQRRGRVAARPRRLRRRVVFPAARDLGVPREDRRRTAQVGVSHRPHSTGDVQRRLQHDLLDGLG
jgi:hypothetical protein